MTVIIAGKYKTKSVIVADSLLTSGKKKSYNLKNFSKLVQFKNCVVGFAGFATFYNVLNNLNTEDYNGNDFMSFKNINCVSLFVDDIYKNMAKSLKYLRGNDAEEDYGELLILTKKTIYRADSSLTITEIKDFVSIGDGEDLAVGCLAYAYPKIKKEEELGNLLFEAAMIACDYCNTCSPDIEMIEL